MGKLIETSDDITKKTQAPSTEEELRMVFDHAPDGLAMLDESGIVRRVNQLAAEIVGLTPTEAVGEHFSYFFPVEYEEIVTEVWEDACAGKATRARLPIGGEHVQRSRVELAASRFDVRDGFRIAVILRDISEENEAMEQLHRFQQKIERMEDMQLIAQLAGGLVHDLNNMLAVITSYGELLKIELSDEPELKADVEEIIEAGETAASLSRRLLAVGRQRGDGSDEIEDLDLNAQIERQVSFLRRVMPPRVQLETHLDNSRPIVEMSSVQLEQVLLNLLLNARDALQGQGRISVETHLIDNHVNGFEHSPVEIHVRDDGCGISPEDIDKIFEPFFTSKAPGEGTGMGLPMARRIVEEAGGGISVDSQPGEGTCVTLRLPTSSTSGSDVGIEDTTLVEESGSERVLVVDGNSTSRRLIERVLAGNGYDVLVASDQRQALQIVANEFEPPELVILDAAPTKPHVAEFVDELSEKLPDVAFVFTVEERLEEPSEFHILERPITPSSLTAAARAAL